MVSPPLQALTAEQLRQHPTVLGALEEAWNDSQADDPEERHEEGGWIYMETSTGTVSFRRAKAGGRASIRLDDPPVLDGSVVIATFHTHPQPGSEGWHTGPSSHDRKSAEKLGVPCLIRADDGIHITGPASRRGGGLSGNPGYPS